MHHAFQGLQRGRECLHVTAHCSPCTLLVTVHLPQQLPRSCTGGKSRQVEHPLAAPRPAHPRIALPPSPHSPPSPLPRPYSPLGKLRGAPHCTALLCWETLGLGMTGARMRANRSGIPGVFKHLEILRKNDAQLVLYESSALSCSAAPPDTWFMIALNAEFIQS